VGYLPKLGVRTVERGCQDIKTSTSNFRYFEDGNLLNYFLLYNPIFLDPATILCRTKKYMCLRENASA
jgi:hypothetical protein